MTRALKSTSSKSACRRATAYSHANGARRTRAARGTELLTPLQALSYTVPCEMAAVCPAALLRSQNSGLVSVSPKTSPSFRVRAWYLRGHWGFPAVWRGAVVQPAALSPSAVRVAISSREFLTPRKHLKFCLASLQANKMRRDSKSYCFLSTLRA